MTKDFHDVTSSSVVFMGNDDYSRNLEDVCHRRVLALRSSVHSISAQISQILSMKAHLLDQALELPL